MRIISGTYKGKRIQAPRGLPVRPTTDFAKEALFNILNHRYYFDEIRVLDLFAGIGSISFEFASRGCESVVSVDAHFGCINFIDKISKELEFPIKTLKSDVFKFLDRNQEEVDIIFADPPYDMDVSLFGKIPELVFSNNMLATDGLLIIEHSKHTDLQNISNFNFSKKYGGSVFSFFENS